MPSSEVVPVTGTGRVCGESASSAPSVTIVSTPSSWAYARRSAQKPRQRMFGSIPCTRTRSRAVPGVRTTDKRVVGHSILRVTPSGSVTIGRVT